LNGPRDVVPLDAACAWGGWSPPDIKHCEDNLCGWIAAPADTWSNLAYLAAAWWLWRRGDAVSRRFAACALGLGATSFFFHASFTFAGQVLDYAAMFAYVLLLLSLNLGRLGAADWRRAYAAAFAFSLAALGLLKAARIGLQHLIVVQVVLVLATEAVLALRRPRARYGPWLAATGLMAAAAVFWALDYSRLLCDPANHLFQAHAVWHLLSAAAIPFVARFYAAAPVGAQASRPSLRGPIGSA
jgi:hypothetical protein